MLVSAPSGGGKNAIIRGLLSRFPDAVQLVTTTTREKRPGEKEGVDYYYISKQAFQEKKDADAFVEYNEYAGNWYGTQWEHLNAALGQYSIVFSQAEVHGKRHLDDLGIPHIAIFLLPENLDILRKRIEERGGTTEESIKERLETAKAEIAASNGYDLRIVNKDGYIEDTITDIVSYLDTEHGLTVHIDKK